MSYSSDACICNFLYHEVKTCDDTYSKCILARLVDLIHPVSPIFLILVSVDGLFQVLRVVHLFEISSGCCPCWLFLTWINRNPLDCTFLQSLQIAPSSMTTITITTFYTCILGPLAFPSIVSTVAVKH
jgi:hypothetical protein